jgi:hypothetical protein
MRFIPFLAALIAATALLPAAASAADRTVTVSAATPKSGWDGTQASGHNTSFFVTDGECGKEESNYCDETLVKIEGGNESAKLKVRIEGFSQEADFDLRVYKSDATGAVGEYQGSPIGDSGASSPLGTADPRNTSLGDYETKEVEKAEGFYLVQVVYFFVNDEGYKGVLELTGATPGAGDPTPPADPGAGGGGTPPPSQGGPQPGAAPLTAAISGIASKAKAAAARGIGFRLECSVACKGSVTAAISANTAKRLGLGKKAVKIGTVPVTLTSAGEQVFRIKVSAKVKKKLKKAKRIVVLLSGSITDSSGGQGKALTSKVTLR